MPFVPRPLTVALMVPPVMVIALSHFIPLVSSEATLSVRVPPSMNTWPLSVSVGVFVMDTSTLSPAMLAKVKVPPCTWRYCSM